MLPEIALVRAAVRRLWDRKFYAYTYQQVTDPETHITETKLQAIPGGPWPCRISRDRAYPATEQPAAPSNVQQEIKLICSEGLAIPAGASIKVWKKTEDESQALRFKSAGVPFKYDYHQEIELQQEEVHP